MCWRIAAALILLIGPGVTRSDPPRSIGPERCSDCHEAAHTDWASHLHAKSWLRLKEADRKKPQCLTCHAPDPQFRQSGVHCETCHGAGSAYAPAHVMRDPNVRGYLGLLPQSVATCQRCHVGGHSPKLKPLNLLELWKKLHHKGAKASPAPPPAGVTP